MLSLCRRKVFLLNLFGYIQCAALKDIKYNGVKSLLMASKTIEPGVLLKREE